MRFRVERKLTCGKRFGNTDAPHVGPQPSFGCAQTYFFEPGEFLEANLKEVANLVCVDFGGECAARSAATLIPVDASGKAMAATGNQEELQAEFDREWELVRNHQRIRAYQAEMVAKHNHQVSDGDAIQALRERLVESPKYAALDPAGQKGECWKPTTYLTRAESEARQPPPAY